MKVLRVFRIVDAVLILDVSPPETVGNGPGSIVGFLTNLRSCAGCLELGWAIKIVLNDRDPSLSVNMAIEDILTASEHERSQVTPVCFLELHSVQERLNVAREDSSKSAIRAMAGWLWLFRDGIYSTDKPPQPHESEEILLRIKSLHFQRDERLRRLREQVANFEAIETNTGREKTRRPLPDDVKLLVWSRDGGACVKCGSQSELHFDHIIAFARGGSDESENIQLLCRSCNLSKSNRLT